MESIPPFRRTDPLTGHQVIYSPQRQARPNEYAPPAKTAVGSCPFCPGQEEETPPPLAVYPNGGKAWKLRVVPNKYPAVGNAGRFSQSSAEADAVIGGHEVIIESAEHVEHLSKLSARHGADVARVYRDRLDFHRQNGAAHAVLFKNAGPLAGASIEHAHSQLIALPFVPPEVSADVARIRRFEKENGECYFCAAVDAAEAAGRMVLQTDRFVAYCPPAARFPYETVIQPKRHCDCFDCMNDEEMGELGKIVHQITGGLQTIESGAAYNTVLHQAPFDISPCDHYHWRIEILPRLARLAGFELGVGVFLNPMVPEQAAAELRAGCEAFRSEKLEKPR